MTSINLRKAEAAASAVSTIVGVFIALEFLGFWLLVMAYGDDIVGTLILLFFVSVSGLLLFFHSWQSIYQILMHIGSQLEEESKPLEESSAIEEESKPLEESSAIEEDSVTRDDVRPSDNSPLIPANPIATPTKGEKRCQFTNFTLGTRCKNWFDGEGQYCDEHS